MGKTINIGKIRDLTRSANRDISQKEFEKFSAKIDKAILEAASQGKNLATVYLQDESILGQTIDRIREEYKEFNAEFCCPSCFEEPTEYFKFFW